MDLDGTYGMVEDFGFSEQVEIRGDYFRLKKQMMGDCGGSEYIREGTIVIIQSEDRIIFHATRYHSIEEDATAGIFETTDEEINEEFTAKIIKKDGILALESNLFEEPLKLVKKESRCAIRDLADSLN